MLGSYIKCFNIIGEGVGQDHLEAFFKVKLKMFDFVNSGDGLFHQVHFVCLDPCPTFSITIFENVFFCLLFRWVRVGGGLLGCTWFQHVYLRDLHSRCTWLNFRNLPLRMSLHLEWCWCKETSHRTVRQYTSGGNYNARFWPTHLCHLLHQNEMNKEEPNFQMIPLIYIQVKI